jgi:tRNA A-37 threonylcarbamoyl transferase component Bud32
MEALTTAIAICQFFIEQKQLNGEAIEYMSDMRGAIERMHPVLVSLNTQGLAVASGVLENLWQCLENAKRIYVKYIDGYSIWKFWVTPGCIKAKAEVHTKKVQGALNELLVALNIIGHNHMVQDQAAGPAAGNNTAAAETVGDTWEIPAEFINMERTTNGLPKELLGQGSFGVVGRGYYTCSTKEKRVAVKMKVSNALARAQQDPTVLRSFKNEVNFICTLEHPNICQCFGAVTRKDGDLVLWIVMEELRRTLHAAIIEKHLELGRYPPEQYVDIVSSIVSAFAYLHTDRRNPIVHRDLKPENVMLTFGTPPVAKLIDFGLAKETRHGVGSTQNVIGTQAWMAPEQKKDGGCSTASDVYAIGLVAEYMWSGPRPSELSDAQAAALVVLTAEQTPQKFANFNLANVTLANFTLALIRKCLNPVRLQSPVLKHVIEKLKMYLIVSRVHPVCHTTNYYTRTRVTKQ